MGRRRASRGMSRGPNVTEVNASYRGEKSQRGQAQDWAAVPTSEDMTDEQINDGGHIDQSFAGSPRPRRGLGRLMGRSAAHCHWFVPLSFPVFANERLRSLFRLALKPANPK